MSMIKYTDRLTCVCDSGERTEQNDARQAIKQNDRRG